MRKHLQIINLSFIALISVLLLACSSAQDRSQSDNGDLVEQVARSSLSAKTDWDAFVQSFMAENYAFQPSKAVGDGLHEYDGQIMDLSAAGVSRYVDWLRTQKKQLVALTSNPSGVASLKVEQAFEASHIHTYINGQLFRYAVSTDVNRNPVFYANRISPSVYVTRNYAPLATRLAAYIAWTKQVPNVLLAMQENLRPPLANPQVTIALGKLNGLIKHIREDVPELFKAVDDDLLQAQLQESNEQLIGRLETAVAWLQRQPRNDDFALGANNFLAMLRDVHGLTISLAELKAEGERDLARNTQALLSACEALAPSQPISACVAKVAINKPEGGVVAGARRQLPGLKAFMLENKLASIPSDQDALVEEAPAHKRFNSAYIEIPGYLEDGLPSVYYIAPPDPAWSEADQQAYIPGKADLLFTSIHEVWPGHFLHFLHIHQAKSVFARAHRVSTTSEGWAHYTEEMMLEAGVGEGAADVRVGQLLNALLRNVRYLSAIGMHTEGMTVAQSQQRFLDEAYQDFGNASQQALRGTYDPGYLSYTLGKLMIRKLRQDWTATRGGRAAWGEFHDTFMRHGGAPIPLIRKSMLGAADDGKLL